MQIIPNVHQISLGFVNAFLIVDEDGLILIDTGLSSGYKKISAYLKSIGHAPEEIKLILLTHADSDHVRSAVKLRRVSGAKILASYGESQALSAGKPSRPIKPRFPLNIITGLLAAFASPKFEVDEVLEHGESIPVLGGLDVVATPGHTPDHISFYAPAHKLLFAGDSLRSVEDTLKRGDYPAITYDREMAIASIKLQAELQPEIVCVGHGPVIFDAAGKFPDNHSKD